MSCYDYRKPCYNYNMTCYDHNMTCYKEFILEIELNIRRTT